MPVETLKADTKHGISRYRDYNCRCEICRRAISEYKLKQRIAKLIPVQPMIDKFGESFCRQYKGSIDKWIAKGINVYTADKICCSKGFHPVEVFGDIWIDNALQISEKQQKGNQ